MPEYLCSAPGKKTVRVDAATRTSARDMMAKGWQIDAAKVDVNLPADTISSTAERQHRAHQSPTATTNPQPEDDPTMPKKTVTKKMPKKQPAAASPKTVKPKPAADKFYRDGSFYRQAFDECSTEFRTLEEHAKHVATVAKVEAQNALWALQVLKTPAHRSNRGRSGCEVKDKTFKLVKIESPAK